jgi:hypothetical protein
MKHLCTWAFGAALLAASACAGSGPSGNTGDDDDDDEIDAGPRVDADPDAPDADPNAPDADPDRPDAAPDPTEELAVCDFMKPSFRPPGGLSPAEVPQFIVIGIDDNRYVDGMEFVLDQLEARHNPAGSGNPRTYDGRPLRASFFFMSAALETGGPELLAQWQRAVADGHEVGNHTATHEVADWVSEIDECNATLISQLGVDPKDIMGFRSPYLNYQQPTLVYPILQGEDHIKYDCTLRHDAYYDYLTPGASTDFYMHIWPYTLDSGADVFTAGNLGIGNYPGLWELPTYALPTSANRNGLKQPAQNYTGFDSTAYGTLNISAEAFENSMKWALDLRLENGDNRAPLLIGIHSDTYSTENVGYAQPLEARKAAIVHFLDYALSKPQVRFVSARQLLQWMCDPKPL